MTIRCVGDGTMQDVSGVGGSGHKEESREQHCYFHLSLFNFVRSEASWANAGLEEAGVRWLDAVGFFIYTLIDAVY